jgi:translation initiation factor 3 subunit M
MPAPTNTLLIEGSLEELADELAQYIDNLRKDAAPIQPEVASLLKEEKTEDALKKLVGAASALNSAPEKGTISVSKKDMVRRLTCGRNRGSVQSPSSHYPTSA